MVLIPTKEHGSPECIATKKRKMDAFKQFYVMDKHKAKMLGMAKIQEEQELDKLEKAKK